jgi:hypothetical protein
MSDPFQDLRGQLVDAARELPARRRRRVRAIALVAAVFATGGTAAAAVVGLSHSATGRPAASPPLIVSCDNIIDSMKSPRAGLPGYRVVLGSVSVPPAYLPQNVNLHQGRWPYWLKAALIVRAGRGPLTVTVPPAWRRRVAITWGNGLAIVSTVQIARCAPAPKQWNVYVGGFRTHSSSQCFPLAFRIGARAQTVWFGIRRRCRAPSE